MKKEKQWSLGLLKRYSVIIIICWTVIIVVSFLWNYYQIKEWTKKVALEVAQAYFEKDIAFRLWGASHGGVYAPVSDWSPPNPYLKHVPERDIITPSGKKLTLINPAYMFRQMLTKFTPRTGVVERITSLKVVNPINTPDDWERSALLEFEKGKKKVVSFTELNGKPYIRLMKPFVTKKPCLKCHGFQGYKVGDIRGGISISLPMEPYLIIERSSLKTIFVSHLIILLLGFGGIFFAYVNIRKHFVKRLEMEESLIKQCNFTNTVINSLTHPFYVIEANNYQIVLANRAASESFSMGNKTCYELTHNRKTPCDGKEHPCPIQEVTRNGRMYSVEHIHYDKDGNERNIQLYCYPVFDEQGKVTQVIEYAIDVTDRKRLEKQLLQAQRLEAIGRLAGGVAHDFNNILSVVLGYCEIALKNLPEGHPVREHIKTIEKAGERASTLTQQLLAFSRKQVLEMKAVDINKVIDSMAKILKRIIGEDIELKLNLESKSKTLVDPAQIEQVIMNLAVNARDAMPEGGALIIETQDIEIDRLSAVRKGGIEPGPYVVISVADTGIGIPEDIKEKIFEPFFTTKERGKGTGLGLSTVMGIVKQHQGHITVYSETGKGTVFKIYLPVTGDSEKTEDAVKDSRDEKPRYGKENILVVDDEPTIVNLLKESLQSLGYRVFTASSAEEALQFSKNKIERVDLLITDVILPGKNGKYLADKLKEIHKDIKVIFMSGYSENAIAHHDILQEGTHFLQKPIAPSKIFKKLKEIFD